MWQKWYIGFYAETYSFDFLFLLICYNHLSPTDILTDVTVSYDTRVAQKEQEFLGITKLTGINFLHRYWRIGSCKDRIVKIVEKIRII